ncbi:hypothetical protein AX774_g5732 [Zancudomyces culisetae]|uniref:Chitin-binding type-4 domain-containing protein n=1 Tax=Zancudomyces culisetae TaxID=1213189 RepID=A0A1R1PIZ1_ZANCU|nr:hypothetical protein AX774_g7597 [Zancudomyces culisetae]OMH80822.1 hypothetical protein AX774_g5732 [Zancudomyces culisetae]|eukprot:OMH79000.1 hypothetical protein AX774_g7597 [Zancudomyces culisetae]
MVFASLVTILLNTLLVASHSWIDCAKFNMDLKTCDGYSRGYPGRENRDINTVYTHLIQARPSSYPICEKNRQGTNPLQYSTTYPMGCVKPGETIYQTWEQNGHLNNTHPTTIRILYSDQESRGLTNYNQVAQARIAGEMVFATDSNCFDPKNPNSVCYGNWTVPAHFKRKRVYSFVWLWRFDSNPVGEEYSTCFDLYVE